MLSNQLSLSPRLELQQKITQQQILRAELLQVPLLELMQRVEVELDQNPLLELVDPTEVRSDDDTYDEKLVGLPDVPEADPDIQEAAPVVEAKMNGDLPSEPDHEIGDTSPNSLERQKEMDWDQYFRDEDYVGGRLPSIIDHESENEQSNEYRSESNFLDSINEQLAMATTMTEEQREIGEMIIGSLNASGYLDTDIVHYIANKMDAEIDQVEFVLTQLQQFDPPGIFARSLRESLILQLKRKLSDIDERSPHYAVYDRALMLIEKYFEPLSRRRFETILDATGMSEDEFKAAFKAIQNLQQTPGVGREEREYVVPELRVTAQQLDSAPPGRIVELANGRRYFIYLNDGVIPDLRISKRYRSMFQEKNLDSASKQWIEQKFEAARNFVKAVQSRHKTMLDVMEWIVRIQHRFFLSGEDLYPLTQLEVARNAECDNSTVSRAIKDKYVETDFGTFSLKHFFSVGLETDSGEDVSTREIKQKLAELIENEDKQHPLTDQALCDKLNDLGFKLARRTVQKYREQLNLPLARFRRNL